MNQNPETTLREPWPVKLLALLSLLFITTGFVWWAGNFVGMPWIGQLFAGVSFLILFLLGFRRYQRTKQRLHLWMLWIYAVAVLVCAISVFDGWTAWRTHQ